MINEQAQVILRKAEQYGLEDDFFFKTTFKRYLVQLDILDKLEETIKAEGTLTTKEYVKGRENVYTHPAVGEFNKTSTAANQTVTTLIKIITTLKEDQEEDDELMEFLKGKK